MGERRRFTEEEAFAPVAERRRFTEEEAFAPAAEPTFADTVQNGLSNLSDMATAGGRLLQRGWETGKRFVTGVGRREEGIAELPQHFDGRPLPPGLMLARDDAQRFDILKQAFPTATNRRDAWGNVIATIPGRGEFYLNKPGASARDIDETVTEGLIQLPVAGLAGRMIGPAANLLTRGAVVGGATGAASAGQDLAIGAIGSQQPIDWNRAMAAAGSGAAFEVLSPLATKGLGLLRQSPSYFDAATGRLTPEGAEVLRRAGIDPDTVTKEFASAFGTKARNAADPAQAARMAEADTLPVKVPMTRGTATLDPRDQMFENLARKGVYGDTAQHIIAGAKQGQADALAANAQAIQSRIGGGEARVSLPGEAGAMAQERLSGMQSAEKAAAGALFDSARSGAGASLTPEGVGALNFRVMESVARDHNLAGLPRTTALLGELDGFTRAGKPTSIAQVFDYRSRIGNAMRAGGEEAVALGKMKRGLDEFLNESLGTAMLTGDEAAIEAFRAANARYRDYASRFKAGDIVEALVEREPRSGRLQFAVPPDQASNAIFGSSRLFGAGNTARDLARLREVLGPGSPEWNALREEAWMRMVARGKGQIAADTGERAFSGANFARGVDDAVSKHKPVLDVLFSPEEMAVIQQFKRVAARVTTTVPGGDNFSNTAVAQANIVNNLFGLGFVSDRVKAALSAVPVVRWAQNVTRAMEAAGAASPPMPAPTRIPPGPLGGLGAVTGTNTQDAYRRRSP